MLRYACVTGCATLPDVQQLALKGAADALVPGSVVFSEARATELVIGFLPEPGAVTPGALYTAELPGAPTVANFLFGPAVTWNDALTLKDEIFEVDRPTGEEVCCSGPLDSCGQRPCFQTQVNRSSAVTVGWYDGQSIEHYQYVFRLGRDGIDAAAPWSWDGGDARFELEPSEDSACYVLELKRLVDDSVQTFTSRCIERPASFTPGLHGRQEEDITAVLGVCADPPDGYEELWCEARGSMCELSPDDPWCPDVAARCAVTGDAGAAGRSNAGGAAGEGGTSARGGTAGRGGTENSGGAAGTSSSTGGRAGSSNAKGGSAGRSGTAGVTSTPPGAGSSGEAGAADGEAGGSGAKKSVYTKGCGCTLPATGSRVPAPFALALALSALGLRRARKRVYR